MVPTPEDQRAAWLAAYDRGLAGDGPTGNAPGAAVPPDLHPRLERDAAFLRLLEAVWPRHAAAGPQSGSLPTHLGHFEIVRELGRGGFGIVYLARDPHLCRHVALKVPKADSLLDPEARGRFLREGRAAAGLDHPHIVPVYEAGEADGICYIASAYCPGISLAEWLRARRDPVPPRAAALLLVTLADAVQHAHARGVLPRDLKPANILLSFDAEQGTSSPLSPARGEGPSSPLSPGGGEGSGERGARPGASSPSTPLPPAVRGDCAEDASSPTPLPPAREAS